MSTKNTFLTAILLYILLLFSSMPVKAQNNLIPNTQDCSGTRPPFSFTIQNAWNSNTGMDINTLQSVFAGDIDGDGVTEILCMNYSANSIYIFDGRTGAIAGTIALGVQVSMLGYWDPMLICDCNRNGRGEIFVVGHNSAPIVRLYEVSSAPGVRPMTFNTLWSHSYSTNHATGAMYSNTMPLVADLDGDGIPEFIASNHIINSQTGLSIAQMPLSGDGTWISFPLAVDLDHDGLPEVVVGTNVYKYNAGVLTLWRTCPALTQQEGVNMAGDIDGDGEIDLVLVTKNSLVKAWTPNTNHDFGTIITNVGSWPSYPFIGDIDGVVASNGKKYLEIVVNAVNQLKAYEFNGTSFQLKWQMAHTDLTGATAMTLFDFNNDGVVEIIYRDQTHLHIFNGTGTTPVPATPSIPCGSGTGTECPIVADVTGDGSANIIVIGDPAGVDQNVHGEVMVFEGAASKWASCPPVWNQQLYSNLHVNTDLTIPTTVESLDLTFTRPDGSTVQFYNGGPMQAPYVSAETYLPIDLSSDIYIVDGNIEVLSSTSVKITITVGNQGLIMAPATAPIHYYKNSIGTANIIDNTVLGVDLYPGQTTVITKTITGLPSGVLFPASFYVRLLDDGTNFPATGAFSDCNLTNNTKSFGTFELTKTANSQSACVDGTVIFTIKLVNNSGQLGNPQTYNNIIVTDSLNSLVWEYVSDATSDGTTTPYNSVTHKLAWNIPTLVPGDTVQLILVAKAKDAGAIRNSSWIESIGGTPIGKEAIEAYVIVASQQAPSAASVLPVNSQLCPGSGNNVTLTAVNAVGATSYQWYRNNVEITGAISDSYAATQTGSYRVTYFNGTCVSQMSSTATISENCIDVQNDIVAVFECDSVMIDVLANDTYSGAVTLSVSQLPTLGSATVSGNYIKYKDTGSCDGNKTDKFRYTASAGADSKQAEVKVFILKAPHIILQDSCSTKPKLILNIHYPATYEWWYSSDGVNYTTNLGISSHEHYPSHTGWYEVRITYTLHGITLTKKIRAKYTILESVNLPNGQKWYVTGIEY